MKNRFIALAMLMLVTAVADATQHSKLSIIRAAKQKGCWYAVKNFITEHDLVDEWMSCQFIDDDNADFVSATNALVSAGVVSAESMTYILTNSIDSAVSERCLRRVYNKDITTSSGRMKWHGKRTRVSVDTNTLVKTTWYEDGTVFKDRASVVRPIDFVNASNAKLPKVAMTNGVPTRLATARSRFVTNTTTESNVVFSVKAGESGVTK